MLRSRVTSQISQFLSSESGAITTDWVVLAAAVVGLGVASAGAVRTGSGELAGDVETSLTGASVASVGCMAPNAATDAYACYSGPSITGQGLNRLVQDGYMMCPMGGMECISVPTIIETTYHMSDGQQYTRTATTPYGGVEEVTWTNTAGDAVEAPPPNPDAPYML